MIGWKGCGPLGSVKWRVSRELLEHLNSNSTIASARYPLHTRALRVLLQRDSMAIFLVVYVIVVGAALGVEAWSAEYFSHALLFPDGAEARALLKDVTSYVLAAQATIIGLIFPVAVAMVTLIVQREESSSTNSDVQIYYHETLAYRVGASGISLVIVLTVQLAWPSQFFIGSFGPAVPITASKFLLTGVHIAWFVLNLAALWNFLYVSLSFIQPASRTLYRRRFAANASIPEDIRSRLNTHFLINAASIFLDQPSEERGLPSLVFGFPLGEDNEAEVHREFSKRRFLVDIWMRPLAWVVRRWMARCPAATRSGIGNVDRPRLIFPLQLGREVSGRAEICQRHGTVPLTTFERSLIKLSFRFSRWPR